MATVEEALRARLLAQVTEVSSRVYPLVLPQGANLPAVSYQRISANRQHLMGADADVVDARFQFSIFSNSFDECLAVKDKVRQALQRFGQVANPVIETLLLITDFDDVLEDSEATARYFRSVLEFRVIYREA